MRCIIKINSEWMDRGCEEDYLDIIRDKYPIFENYNLQCDSIECYWDEYVVRRCFPIIIVDDFNDIKDIINNIDCDIKFSKDDKITETDVIVLTIMDEEE